MFEVVEGEPMSIAQFRSGLRYEIKKEMSHVYFFFFFEKLSHVYLKDLEDATETALLQLCTPMPRSLEHVENSIWLKP